MQQPTNTLSVDMLARIRALVLEQIALKDELALETGDDAVALRLARRVCGLEQQAIEQ
jgi:hypothetical protein